MYTRVVLVAGLTGPEMEAVMNVIRDPWLPSIAACPGFLGYSVFGNPDSGRGGMSTAWESPETLQASEEASSGLQEAAVAAINYRRKLIVETYEMLAWGAPTMAERAGRPLHMRRGRVTDLQVTDVESVREAVMNEWLPQLERLPGFLGYSVFGNLNRRTGGMTTLWASRSALIRSADVEEQVYRSAAVALTGGRRSDAVVDRYELLAWEVPKMPERVPAI